MPVVHTDQGLLKQFITFPDEIIAFKAFTWPVIVIKPNLCSVLVHVLVNDHNLSRCISKLTAGLKACYFKLHASGSCKEARLWRKHISAVSHSAPAAVIVSLYQPKKPSFTWPCFIYISQQIFCGSISLTAFSYILSISIDHRLKL